MRRGLDDSEVEGKAINIELTSHTTFHPCKNVRYVVLYLDCKYFVDRRERPVDQDSYSSSKLNVSEILRTSGVSSPDESFGMLKLAKRNSFQWFGYVALCWARVVRRILRTIGCHSGGHLADIDMC